MVLWFCLFENDHVNEIMQCVAFSVWLLSSSIIHLMFIHMAACISSLPFLSLCSVPCVNVQLFVIPLPVHNIWIVSSVWQLWMNYCEHLYTGFAWVRIFISLGYILESRMAGLYDKYMLHCLNELPNHLLMWLYPLAFPPLAMHEISSCFASFSAFGIVRILILRHFNSKW